MLREGGVCGVREREGGVETVGIVRGGREREQAEAGSRKPTFHEFSKFPSEVD